MRGILESVLVIHHSFRRGRRVRDRSEGWELDTAGQFPVTTGRHSSVPCHRRARQVDLLARRQDTAVSNQHDGPDDEGPRPVIPEYGIAPPKYHHAFVSEHTGQAARQPVARKGAEWRKGARNQIASSSFKDVQSSWADRLRPAAKGERPRLAISLSFENGERRVQGVAA